MASQMDTLRARGAELLEAFRELQQVVYDILASRKLQRFIINTILVFCFAAFSYCLSIPAYATFYHFYLPDQIVTVPLHFQYGYGAHPFAVSSLAGLTEIKNTQAYDIKVSLTMPHSPDNLERGNFMVGLLLVGDRKDAPQELPHRGGASSFIVPPLDIPAYLANKQVLHSVTRPTRVPFRSPMVARASSLLRLPYYALWPGSEINTIAIPMAERVRFGRGASVPTSMIVEVQAGQVLQVYDAAVILTAQLKGLRYFMYQYRITAFLLFTSMFWATAMLVFSILFSLPERILPTGIVLGIQSKEATFDDDNDDDRGRRPVVKEADDLSDTERMFPSIGKQPALKFKEKGKEKEGIDSDIPVWNPGAEADDEDDDDWRARDSGIGTSYSDNRSRAGTRRRTSGGPSS